MIPRYNFKFLTLQHSFKNKVNIVYQLIVRYKLASFSLQRCVCLWADSTHKDRRSTTDVTEPVSVMTAEPDITHALRGTVLFSCF